MVNISIGKIYSAICNTGCEVEKMFIRTFKSNAIFPREKIKNRLIELKDNTEKENIKYQKTFHETWQINISK